MNDFQTKLYNDLKHLVETNEAFFSKIQEMEGVHYLVFNYRLATYTDFLIPNARESRGIMFELDSNGNPIRLACFMPQKFFNLGEGATVKLDLSDDNIDGIMDKMDGSIISTFLHKGVVTLKSKTSLHSEHVQVATNWLNNHPTFKAVLQFVTGAGYSVHMELTSPVLRIVLGYEEVKLTILSIRQNDTGQLINRRSVSTYFGEQSDLTTELLTHWVTDLDITLLPEYMASQPSLRNDPTNVCAFLDAVKHMNGIEGFVIRTKCGDHVKLKTDWYCALHHTKDSVSAPRRLFECIVNEGADDLKGMFAEDIATIQRIVDMETKVTTQYNHIIATVELFYQTNRELSRKDYAITANKVDDGLMGLKMNMFLGKENDYKVFALKHFEMFDINEQDNTYQTEEVE